jgi:hypothetical protein
VGGGIPPSKIRLGVRCVPCPKSKRARVCARVCARVRVCLRTRPHTPFLKDTHPRVVRVETSLSVRYAMRIPREGSSQAGREGGHLWASLHGSLSDATPPAPAAAPARHVPSAHSMDRRVSASYGHVTDIMCAVCQTHEGHVHHGHVTDILCP